MAEKDSATGTTLTPATDFFKNLADSSTSTSTNGPILFVDHNSNRRLRLLRRIGVFADDLSKPVYKGIRIFNGRDHYTGMTLDDVVTVVKYMKTDSIEYRFLLNRVKLSQKVPRHPHLIPIVESFIDDDHHVVAFPFMRGGSIRHILTSKYPHGMPEDWILLILKAILSGLVAMHERGAVHGEVHAGNIFISGDPKIKLAYGASTYIPEAIAPPFCPPSDYYSTYQMAYWAAAPEVYRNGNGSNSPKADTWMVGITALELACGSLWVKNREEFDNAIQEINRKRELPKQAATPVWRRKGMKVFEIKREELSKSFENLVVRCLRWETDARPTVAQLLQWSLFRRMGWFYDTVRNAAVHETEQGLIED